MTYIDPQEQAPYELNPAQRRKFVVIPGGLSNLDQLPEEAFGEQQRAPELRMVPDVHIETEAPVVVSADNVTDLNLARAAREARDLAVPAQEGLDNVSKVA